MINVTISETYLISAIMTNPFKDQVLSNCQSTNFHFPSGLQRQSLDSNLKLGFHSCILLIASEISATENQTNKSYPKFLHLISEFV